MPISVTATEAELTGWDDPAAGPKITELLRKVMVKQADRTGPEHAWVQRTSLDQVAHEMMMFQGFSMALISAGIMFSKCPVDSLRVEAGPDTHTNTLIVKVYGRPALADGEQLLGELRQQATDPTATGGLTVGAQLHLTPAGSRALWDFGDVVAAEATEKDNYNDSSN